MSELKEISDRFLVDEQVEKRPNAIIYKGRDKKLGDVAVAVKVFVDKPGDAKEVLESFEAEVKVLRAASHHALVPVLAGGLEGESLYLVMEFINGPTLRDLLKDEGAPIEPERALHIAKEIGLALFELHEAGGFHGHLDSRAVLFKGEEVRVAGYCPRAVDELQGTATSTGRLTIQPAYVSPEQLGHVASVDHRADIYALAVLLFEMLTAQRPFSAPNPLQTAMLRLTVDAPEVSSLVKNIPPVLNAAVKKALSRNPDDRFNSMKEFLDMATGGKEEIKNPLQTLGIGIETGALSGTETMPVSMSASKIQELLRGHNKLVTDGPSQGKESAAGSMDAAQTVMGISSAEILPGSLVFLSGNSRGHRIELSKSTTIIGSDSNCDVVIAEESVAARHAMISSKEGSYFVAGLAPTGFSLNGEEITETAEIKLGRGDVLGFGESELRFVAPGEVFTLRDDVADRIIDRPKSRAPLFLGGLAVVLAVVGFVVFQSYSESVAKRAKSKKVAAEEKAVEREKLIADLIREGDSFFRSGQLLEPAGDNAYERFQDVLELDTENVYARQRLGEIKKRAATLAEREEEYKQRMQKVEKLLATGKRYFDAKSYVSPPGKNAREAYREALRLDSDNQTAKEMLAKIDAVLQGMLGKIESAIAQAEVYKSLGQYTEPAGENAYEELQEVLAMDPESERAKDMLYEMAAENIVLGDRAKASARPDAMRKAYLTAQALGANPEFIKEKMKGADLMKRARSSIIIVQGNEIKDGEDDTEGGRYLSRREITKRASALAAKYRGSGAGAGRRYLEIGN